MELLIVDDQKTVVDGLKKGVHWKELGISRLYFAYDAKSAKSILDKKQIHILLSDIEMPGESGIELFQWAREQKKNVECIFLTSHADFEFAKDALKLGGADYILQPAPYKEVEEAILKVKEKICKKQEIQKYSLYGREFLKSKDIILENSLRNFFGGEKKRFDDICDILQKFQIRLSSETKVIYGILWVDRYHGRKQADQGLLRAAVSEALRDIISRQGCRQINVLLEHGRYAVLIYPEKDQKVSGSITQKSMELAVRKIGETAGANLSGVISDPCPLRELEQTIENVIRTADEEQENSCSGRFFFARKETCEEQMHSYVETVVQYIRCNIQRDIRREEIAAIVGLNEDYLSRIFKKEHGISLKEYILLEKMKTAQRLLRNTDFSIGTISVKVGFDNFSHFSQTYKRVMKKTPTEERE